MSTGALFGSGLGFLLLEARGFKATAPLLTQVLKVAIALGVLFRLEAGAKELLGEAAWATALSYGLVGFVAAYVLPVFFSQCHVWRLRIIHRIQRASQEANRSNKP